MSMVQQFANGLWVGTYTVRVRFVPPGLPAGRPGQLHLLTGSAGHYQDLQAQSECTRCSAGSYQAIIQTSSCDLCPPGKAGTVTNSTSEEVGCSIHCPPGYYSGMAATSCVDCPVDTYSWAYLTGPACLSCPSFTTSEIR